MSSVFKKSSISEMCKQIVSAPVIFKMRDGTECLAFYNNEDPIEATKLYILFPDNSLPKYIEENELYTVRECIIHGISSETATELYNKVNRTHKTSTKEYIMGLIAKADEGKEEEIEEPSTPESMPQHTVYNKKHACGWVNYQGKSVVAFMKDLVDKDTSELIIDGNLEYNATLDCVYWAAGITSKEFTALKAKLREVNA